MNYGRFGFQGDRQFYADVTGIMMLDYAASFRVGSDGKECWNFYASHLPDSPKENKVVQFRACKAVRRGHSARFAILSDRNASLPRRRRSKLRDSRGLCRCAHGRSDSLLRRWRSKP